MLTRIQEKLDHTSTAADNVIWYRYSGKNVEVLVKLKMDPATVLTGIYSRSSHKILQMNVYSSFIYNSQNLETTQVSFIGSMATQTVVHKYCGLLLANKNYDT